MKVICLSFLLIFFVCSVYSQNIIQYGDSIEIELSDYAPETVQWQYSIDNENWLDIVNEGNLVLKYKITEDTFFRAILFDKENCEWFTKVKKILFDQSKKIYGVRIDRRNIIENRIERILNSIGKNSFLEVQGEEKIIDDDFDNIFPYNQLKICNLIYDQEKKIKIIHSTDVSFTRLEDTFVEIPLFYMKRYFENDFDYRLISKTQYEGFYPAPMFLEGGEILDKVYVAVYETSIDEQGSARTITGQLPLTEKTISEFRSLYTKKGNGFSQMDVRTIMSLQHLYLVCFANKNSQELIGGGWSNLVQPTLKIMNIGMTNEVVINEVQSVTDWYWFKNQNVCIVNNDNKTINTNAILKYYKKDTPKKNQTTIYLDRKISLDTTMHFGSSAQLTGISDNLTHNTGRSIQYTTKPNNQACSVKLFGIENLWGNVWEFLDGLVYNNSTPYVGFSCKEYNDNAIGYVPMVFKCIEQTQNHPMDGTFGFVNNLGIDKNNTWLSFPDYIGGVAVDSKHGYGDFYYHSNSENVTCTFGGGFDNYYRNGLFTFRSWSSSSTKWYLYGSRMQFKPIN